MSNNIYHSGLRALIVEDEVLVALDMEYILRTAGYEIAGSASSLTSAFALLESTQIDFAVLDINLAGVTVFPLARELRTRQIPYFFLTGYSQKKLIPEEFLKDVCLEKPCQDSLLLGTIAQLACVIPLSPFRPRQKFLK